MEILHSLVHCIGQPAITDSSSTNIALPWKHRLPGVKSQQRVLRAGVRVRHCSLAGAVRRDRLQV